MKHDTGTLTGRRERRDDFEEISSDVSQTNVGQSWRTCCEDSSTC